MIIIEQKVGGSLEHIGTGDQCLNKTPVSQTLRPTINKQDVLKLRSFCKAKDMANKAKQHSTEWENIFNNPTLDRGMISKVYKELKKLDIKIPKQSN